MHVIITGGSGLIGKAFSALLIERGHQVWNLSRHPERVKMQVEVQQVAWDGQTSQGWGHLVEQADAIVNLAGESLSSGLWTVERKRRIRASRTNAGKAIVAAVQAAAHKPRVVLQSSAVGFYGALGDQQVNEATRSGNNFLAGVCVDWETSTLAVTSSGVRLVAMRTGLVLARNEGILPLIALPYRLFVGGPFGNGNQWYSWISLEDQVEAMYFLLQKEDAQGPYNLCAPQPLRMSDFGRTVAKILHRPYWFPTPAFALRLALGEMSTLVLSGQRVLPDRLLKEGYQFRYPELAQALAYIYH